LKDKTEKRWTSFKVGEGRFRGLDYGVKVLAVNFIG